MPKRKGRSERRKKIIRDGTTFRTPVKDQDFDVTVGDRKSSKFRPKIECVRFKGASRVSLGLEDDDGRYEEREDCIL